MIELTIFVTRRPDLSHREFLDCWRDRHAPPLLDQPEFRALVRRCVQQHPVEHLPDGLPVASYDGVEELWFDDLGALASDTYETVAASDEENFVDRTKTRMMVSSESQIV